MSPIEDRKKNVLPALPGFEKIQRFWDSSLDNVIAKIKPGEFYVSRTGEVITTVLGSCVAACIWDSQNRIGGMNHFMLPLSKSAMSAAPTKPTNEGESARYGNWAMEYLVNSIIRNGGIRRNLEIKIFGGSAMTGSSASIGQKNVDFITRYVYEENMKVAAQDLGGNEPRLIHFDPVSGKVKLRKIKESVETQELLQGEKRYQKDISKDINDKSNDVELF